MMQPNWKFARDLVLIRMIELLYADNWFRENPDALPEGAELDTAALASDISQ